MEKKRCGWLDVMKLLCIYGVYVLHYPSAGRIGMLFGSFVIGALFFASGCAVSMQREVPLRQYVWTRFQRLMVPYFVFGLGTLAVRVLLVEMSLGEIIGWVRGLLIARRNSVPMAALWFLPSGGARAAGAASGPLPVRHKAGRSAGPGRRLLRPLSAGDGGHGHPAVPGGHAQREIGRAHV